MIRISLVCVCSLLSLTACQPSFAATPAPFTAATFPTPPAEPTPAEPLQTAVFAGGCFWGIEAIFDHLKGVTQAVSGYSGGRLDHPSYEDVSSGATGHAEAVEVTFDPRQISYGTLLKVFFSVGLDPTQLNYQGPDHGTQYRSALFVKTPAQKQLALDYIKKLNQAKLWPAPIVTEVTDFSVFWPAEDYHQDFIKKNPTQGYIVRFDLPKLRDLDRLWPELVTPGSSLSAAPTWHGLPVHSDGEALTYPVVKSDADWQKLLSPLAYNVLRQAGTEAPWSGPLNAEHRKGTFYSAATGQPLFRSEDKFDSGTGWPSFTRSITPEAVVLLQDNSYGMDRIAVVDSASGSHLGHVFDDGPAPTGLRFCMNSVSLLFVPDGTEPPALVKSWQQRP